MIAPLPEKDSVSIEQIRDLKQWLAMSPLAGINKVAIVEAAEKMNEASQNAFLKVLEELGGEGHHSQILDILEEKMKSEFNEIDREDLKTGEVRWKKNAEWQRYIMTKKGLLDSNSSRGIWKITEKGKEYLKSMKS